MNTGVTLDTLRTMGLLLGLSMLNGCHAATFSVPANTAVDAAEAPISSGELRIWMSIGAHRFAITLANHPAARAFVAQLPLTLDMTELNGNEKYVSLPKTLPTEPIRPGVIHKGDLMLYGTDTLVVFYATFNSPYAYTPLGHVVDPVSLAQALGQQGVRVVFSRD